MINAQDRRKTRIRLQGVTLGLSVSVLGAYAFLPMETLFTRVLSSVGAEFEWGMILVTAGLCLALSGVSRNRFVRWFGNAFTSLACGWTFILFLYMGVVTPTIAVCGVIALGTFVAMLRDALEGRRIRGRLRDGSEL